MNTTERIRDIIDSLEEAITYESMEAVEDSRKELMFLLQDLESDFPSTFDEDY